MHHFFHLNLGRIEDRNAWYLVVEIFWASMLAGAITFNAAFAVRLGATNAQVGLLTSLPALLAVIVSIPAGRFMHQRAQRKPWIVGSLLLYRLGYVLVAFLPWLHFAGISSGSLMVFLVVTFSIPVHFFNVGFIPMLSEVVPERNRASVFAARNMFYNLALSVFVYLYGLWLDRVAFPYNYLGMYLFGFAFSVLSTYYVFKVQMPESPVVTEPPEAPAVAGRYPTRPPSRSLGEWLQRRYQSLTRSQDLLRLTFNTILHGMGLWAALPLYVLYYVRDLNASEGWLGINGTIASASTILGFAFWRWGILRWGELPVLKRLIVMLGFYPLAVALLPSLGWVLLATAINGLLTPGVNLSHFNTLLKVTPEENRPAYTATYIAIVNIGIFLLPLIGVALADRFGFTPVLIGCGLFSVLGSTSFWFWKGRAMGR